MRIAKSELTNDEIILRIMATLKSQGKTEKDLEKAVGLSNGTFTAWKYRNGKSYMLHIEKIANYLDISPNYLLLGVDDEVNTDVMTDSEISLVKAYRMLDSKRRKQLIEIAKDFVEAIKYEEITKITK